MSPTNLNSVNLPPYVSPERILILGCSGSGKSTLSRNLASLLQLPVVHMDQIFWNPHWTPRPTDQVKSIIHQKIQDQQWIMDGNYTSTLPDRAQQAHAIIHLDFPRSACLLSVIQRIIKGAILNHPRPDMAEHCPERWDWDFIEWIWNFHIHSHPKIVQTISNHKSRIPVLKMCSRRQVADFLISMQSNPVTAWLNPNFQSH